MAQKIYYFKGKCKWAKVHQSQLDSKYANPEVPGDGVWTIDLYPDAASLDEFKKSGSKLEVKASDEGPYIRFKRKRFMAFNGEQRDVGPPQVRDSDDKAFEGTIGNGSTVTLKVEVYDTKRFGKGTRLNAVRVDELVEFVPGDFAPAEEVPF